MRQLEVSGVGRVSHRPTVHLHSPPLYCPPPSSTPLCLLLEDSKTVDKSMYSI